jgi:hypothetical protein
MEFENFLETCNTGDLLLFSSNAIYSRLIEILSGGKYSHIGYIIKNPTWLHPDLSGVYIFESGKEPTKDVLSNELIFGVQLTPIETIINQYKNARCGYLYYIKNNFTRTNDYFNQLKDTIFSTDKKIYDFNPIDWIRAKFDINVGKRKTNTFFCSALVAYIMEKVNQLPNTIDWTNISPKRFSKNSTDFLEFINCDIEGEIFLKL